MYTRRKMAIALTVMAGGLTCGASSAFAAGGGYGPVPPATGAPGGFTAVVSSRIIGPSGGTISTESGGISITVTVPAGALDATDDLVISKGDPAATTPSLAGLGYGNYKAVADFGINLLDSNGAKLSGPFNKSVIVAFNGPGLGARGEQVIELTGPDSAKAVPFALGSGSVTVSISSDPDLAILAATGGAAGTVATVNGATSQHTGKPFLAENVAAAGLTLVGLSSLALSRRRRRA